MLRRDLLVSSLAAALIACGRGSAPRGQAGARTLAAASINALAIDLHRALAARPGNLVVSPASITVALAMVHAGARGDTEQALETRLRLADADFATTLRRWDVASDELTLAVASRLFGDRGVDFSADYLERLDQRFAAPLESLDLRGAPEAGRDRVNAWVAEQTHGRVQNVVPAGGVDTNTRLLLVSAIYFKARWAEEFSPRATVEGTFYAAEGERKVPMMARSGQVRLGVGVKEKVRLLELKYRGDAFSLLIILPDARYGLASLEAGLDMAVLQRWLDTLAPEQVEIRLPKFRVEPPSLPLAEALGDIGLGAVFAADADLSGMAPTSAQIVVAQAYHKAFLAIDEQGTEAAAASATVAMEGHMGPPKPRQQFIVDHPFMFMIRDVRDGSILFMGHIVDPTG